MNFQTKNLIILYYPPGAGGKFIANCLALSKRAVSQNPHATTVEIENGRGNYYEYHAGSSWPTYAEFLRGADHPEMADVYLLDMYRKYCILYNSESFSAFKFQVIAESLPDKSNLRNWLVYEYGCGQFFGKNVTSNQAGDYSYVSAKISHLTTKFFIVAHNKKSLENIQSIFPNATVIKLANYSKFATIACAIKNIPVTETLPGDFPITIDMDNSIMSETTFIPAIEELYSKLGFDDFALVEQNLREFYRAYAALHF